MIFEKSEIFLPGKVIQINVRRVILCEEARTKLVLGIDALRVNIGPPEQERRHIFG